MQINATDAEDYLAQLPRERQAPMRQLRTVLLKHLPAGFQETVSYGMITYCVPHSIYPPGYHVFPKQPLPFVSIAAQKNFVALYHMGLYSDPALLKWWTEEYPKHSKWKLDMGKSCVRFKKPEQIPFDLIGELAEKMTPEDWVNKYEAALKK